MAEFISNSAIWTTIPPQRRAYDKALDRPRARKMEDFKAKYAIGASCRANLFFGQRNKWNWYRKQDPRYGR